MQLIELDRRALDAARWILSPVTAADLDRPTPCADWALRELLVHLVSENQGFASAVQGGTDRAVWTGGTLDPDPIQAFAASAALVTEAFAADDVLGRTVEVREFGVLPGKVAVMMHVIDTVAHSWDVASTLGQVWELDDDLVGAALEMLLKFPLTRGPGQAFGEEIAVSGEASVADRFLAFTGRDPRWERR
ncbi:TIGR03086 family metal-binding protein [Streptomyces sp. RKAG293]|uniref:TIGR03086 family metal-binding protein n=1 Tax=Streptomyces sp. RKAG293 TaxID=2893403 RepID=UPI00203423CB|nr:TIGR03086 family metal-binding protein [Streptomyces sp. RKAG293]MCM2422887.1 TIGR03086 family metal-binding protein [Streptomyces sp. RKAG293]